MKKTLIALAAVAATGAAFAQSSVTLYGVADVAIAKSTGSSAKLASSTGQNNGNSRWGIKGTEDLGGGLKAGFNYEAALSLNDGSVNQSGGQYFSRYAFLNLTGDFGETRFGRTLNPSYFAAAAWELTGTANYSAATTQFGSVLGGIRNSSQISYTTPNLGGFSATLGYILKGNNLVGVKPAVPGVPAVVDPVTGLVTTPAVPAVPANLGTEKGKVDLNAIYKNGPVAVALGYNKVSGEEKNVHLGASAAFGIVTVAGAFADPAGDSKGFTLGVGVKAGPVNLVFDAARDTEAKDTDLLFEVKYPLSKRTFTYAAFLRDGEGKPNQADKKSSKNVNNLSLGIRHNF